MIRVCIGQLLFRLNMVNKAFKMKVNKLFTFLSAGIFVIMFCSSCSNQENQELPKETLIRLGVLTPDITENEDNLEMTRSSSSVLSSETKLISAGNGLELVATLERNASTTTRGVTSLATGIKYRVLVFKQNDVSTSGYISYADYEVGVTGPIAGELHVPTEATYTFACYSLNGANLPVFDPDLLDVTADPVTDDLLYTKFDQAITTTTKTITFSFLHRFSQVIVIGDATSLEKDISAISANLSPNYSATLNLSSGLLAPGTVGTRTIPWGTITTGQTVTSIPCTVFTNGSSSVTVYIPSLTIGGKTKTNLTATFGSSVMQAGAKYTLRLKIYRAGIYAAGVTWAPGNLAKLSDKYVFAATQEYYSGVWDGGDYWNWCSLDPINYVNHAITYDATVDPCQKVDPAGTWRMPTLQELTNLIILGSVWSAKNGVNGRYFGTSSSPVAGSEDTYVFLPAAGTRFNASTEMSGMGVNGRYWSAENPYVAADGSYWGYDVYFRSLNIRPEQYPCINGYPIRCVK